MKASETRELIDLSISVAFGNTKKDNKQLHELCQKADEELQRLERLAKIGRATELAFDLGESTRMVAVEMKGSFKIQSIQELLR